MIADTMADRVLFTSDKEIATIKSDNKAVGLEYCTVERASRPNVTSDPAFHYSPETFDPMRANPWERVGVRTVKTQCRDYILATGRETGAAAVAGKRADPITGMFTGVQPKTYLGWPVAGCFPAPSGLVLLCTAEKPPSEKTGEPGEDVLFVATGKDFSQKQEVLRIHGREWQNTTPLWTNGGRLLVIRRGPASSEIDEYDLQGHATNTITRSKWGIYNLHLSSDDRYLFATREEPNVPPQFCRIDLQNGGIVLLDQLNPRFATITMPSYKPMSIANEYGDVVNGYLFEPMTDDHKPHPFIAIRGMDEDGFALGTGEECPGLVLAAEGYYVFFFEMSSLPYHPSSRGDTAYTLLRWKSPLASISKLIDDLATQSLVDKSQTGIAGLSAGADLVDYASAFSNTFHAGEATTGEVPAPPNYLLFENWRVKRFFAESMSIPFPDPAGIEKWSSVSATVNASHATMPMLFQAPDSEALLGFWQPAAMIRAGVPADLYVYPDEGHIKVHPMNRYYVMTRNLQWFDFWLHSVEDPRPEFADQFKRWEQMRADWEKRKSLQTQSPSSSKAEPNPARQN